MANNKKAIYGTGTGGWFQNEGEKRDLPHLHAYETVPNYDKKREYITLRQMRLICLTNVRRILA
jgi:hypothetical protein